MKSILSLLILFTLFSCSNDIQTNTPALQGKVDNVFFRANVSNAVVNDDGSITITGETAVETIEITAASSEIGAYAFGTGSTSIATFTDFNDAFYTTNNSGNGRIDITNIQDGKITANFNFNARRPGINDTLNFSQGIIYEVPITNAVPDDTNPNDDGSSFDVGVRAQIDGQEFYDSSGNITSPSASTLVINASNATQAITMSFNATITPGTYALSSDDLEQITYQLNGNNETITSATFVVLFHDQDNAIIRGTFQFTTQEGSTITNGEYNITY